MNKLFVITLSKIITLLGFFLGFSTKVAAQYGVWEAPYRYSGEVKSHMCNEPVKGIKVTLEDEQKNILAQTYTTEYGQFSIRYYAYDYDKTLYLHFADVDGPDNNGSFLTFSSALSTENENKLKIQLTHAGAPPCLKEETNNEVIEYTLDKSQKDLIKAELSAASDIEPMPIKNPFATALPEYVTIPESDMSITLLTSTDNNEGYITEQPLQDILVFPNPNNGSFTLFFTALEKGSALLSVYTPTGQLIYETYILTTAGSQENKIQLAALAKGTYILTLSQGKQTYTSRILIK
ncbi:MAG: hypothetical protein BWY70_00835 [Bacteroidetes bacterium ADurb.Bin408]|nr:MAG: hypothetical protein BWY70_00835 [Bacteroidetes bacterium ADurb.Bin408]